MDSTPEDGSQNLRERVASLLQQLRVEAKLLERIVYKGKNQHRRCQYFKSVLKVKRDLALLLRSGVEEIFTNIFRIINEEEPGQRVHLLEKMKDRNVSGRCNIHERLFGIARLLSEMTEPIILAAVQISCLLARSFFMGYSLLLLSLLGRTRVLLQQILLDSVLVFNMVSDISQKKHSVKVEAGLEAYREYHPPQREVMKLQCVWEKDKFVLHETSIMHIAKEDDEPTGKDFIGAPAILYETLSVPFEGLDTASEQMIKDLAEEPPSPDNADDTVAVATGKHGESISDSGGKYIEKKTDGSSITESSQTTTLAANLTPLTAIRQTEPSKKVAFLSVRKTAASHADNPRTSKKVKQSGLFNSEGDPFFNLLAAGCKKENASS